MMMQYRTHVSNVLVIGTGAAGLRAAIAAHEAGCDVVLVGKSLKRDAHTVLAAGGINAALGMVDPEDSWQQHFADTYRDGYGLANPLMVERLVIVEVKAVERFERVHSAQLLSYLRLSGCKVGLLLNFNVKWLVDDGIKRVVNGFPA